MRCGEGGCSDEVCLYVFVSVCVCVFFFFLGGGGVLRMASFSNRRQVAHHVEPYTGQTAQKQTTDC